MARLHPNRKCAPPIHGIRHPRSARHELLLFAMKQSHTRYLVFRQTSSALGNREKWASFNKCSDYKSPYLDGGDAFQCGVPVEGSTKGYFIETSRDCHGDVEVANVVVERGGHVPYPGSEDGSPDVISLMWSFLSRYPENPKAEWIPDSCTVDCTLKNYYVNRKDGHSLSNRASDKTVCLLKGD